jgi:hypothetical protein
MRRAAVINAALVLLVGGIALFLHLRPVPGLAPAYTLSALSPDQVTRVQVERGGPPIVLEKRAGIWHLQEPYRARADAFRVRQLLDLLTVKASRKLPATDLARFDLDRPAVRVVFDDQAIAFGMVNDMSNEQYVRAGDDVYLIPVRQSAALPQDPQALTGRQLFAPDEELAQITVGPVTLSQEEGHWRLSPETSDVSPDDLNRWAEDWKAAASLVTGKMEASRGGDTIGVRLKNGKTLRLVVLQGHPELVLGREDEGLQYHFSAAAGKRLLTVPSGASK